MLLCTKILRVYVLLLYTYNYDVYRCFTLFWILTILLMVAFFMNVFLEEEGPNASETLNRILFFTRMEHSLLMDLVSHSDVVLDTFPWGMGVTAFEAFSLCLPVVTLPSKTTVLQLVLGQVKTYLAFPSNFVAPTHLASIMFIFDLSIGRWESWTWWPVT